MEEIQKFQMEFDKRHFAKALDVSKEERLLFMSNELCGEAGEFANLIKKIARRKMFDIKAGASTLEELKEQLAEEITDVLICCVIIGNILEIDLKKEYFKKQRKNELKFE